MGTPLNGVIDSDDGRSELTEDGTVETALDGCKLAGLLGATLGRLAGETLTLVGLEMSEAVTGLRLDRLDARLLGAVLTEPGESRLASDDG